ANAPGQAGSPWEAAPAIKWEVGRTAIQGSILSANDYPFFVKNTHVMSGTAPTTTTPGANFEYLAGVIKGWASDGSQWTEGVTYYEWQTIIHNRTIWFYDSLGQSVATQANRPGQSGSPWIKFNHYIGDLIYPPKTYLLSYDSAMTTAKLTARLGGTWSKLSEGYYLVSGYADGTLKAQLPNFEYRDWATSSAGTRGAGAHPGSLSTSGGRWHHGKAKRGASNYDVKFIKSNGHAMTHAEMDTAAVQFVDGGTVRPQGQKVICFYRNR
ncbi:MAG: hypothetical protein AAF975_06985, partial [Spirochaetota bacterium]